MQGHHANLNIKLVSIFSPTISHFFKFDFYSDHVPPRGQTKVSPDLDQEPGLCFFLAATNSRTITLHLLLDKSMLPALVCSF